MNNRRNLPTTLDILWSFWAWSCRWQRDNTIVNVGVLDVYIASYLCILFISKVSLLVEIVLTAFTFVNHAEQMAWAIHQNVCYAVKKKELKTLIWYSVYYNRLYTILLLLGFSNSLLYLQISRICIFRKLISFPKKKPTN